MLDEACPEVHGTVTSTPDPDPICHYTQIDPVYPDVVTLPNGQFEITCHGEYENYFNVHITDPNNQPDLLG